MLFLWCWAGNFTVGETGGIGPNCRPSTEKAAIQIGVASMITPVDAIMYYQDVIDYTGAQIGQSVRIVHPVDLR